MTALAPLLILSLPFLYVLARKPVLRRLALRNARRRPREAMLVIAGSLLGTAIMTGSFVIGDTFTSSIRVFAYDQLGPTDEIVAVVGLEGAKTLDEKLGNFTHPEVDGLLAVTRIEASSATVGEGRRAAPTTQVLEVDFDAARGFGGDERATGMSGSTPAPGHAVVGEDLARELRVGKGDDIDVFAYGASTRLTIDDVLPQKGVAGLWMSRESLSPNVFVAPGTIASLVADSPGDSPTAVPPVAMMLVSNRGGVIEGAPASDEVKAAIEDRLEGVPANIATLKEDLLDNADESGAQLMQLFTMLGGFAIIAGVLLLVNIFVMLADERRSELGMLRAVGMRRSSLVGAFATEGWSYAILSSVAGTFVGLGLGRVIMGFAARIFEGGDEEFRLPLRFAFEWESVGRGMAIGFAIAVLTVVATSVQISRVNIIRAIRDITEPVRRRPRRRVRVFGWVLAFGGVAAAAGGFSGAQAAGVLLGPPMAVTGIAIVLARRLPRGVLITTASVLVLAWGAAAIPTAVAVGADIDIMMFFVQGVVLTAAAVSLVSWHQSGIGQGLSRLAGGSLDVRLGLAYPLARRFRTAMTLSMFSIVMFVLVYVTSISDMFQGQLDSFTDRIRGGFDAIVTSSPSNPIGVDALRDEEGVRDVAPLVTLDAEITPEGAPEPTQWLMTGFDGILVERGAPELEDRGDYASDEAAYRAVLADPSLAIVDTFFLADNAGPPSSPLEIGDEFEVKDPLSGAASEFTVAAIGPDDWVFNGGLAGVDAMKEIYGERAVPNRAYVSVENPDAFADTVAAKYLENGGESEAIRTTVENLLSQQMQFFQLMRGYLALGLVVGIAGIGVVMVRAVRERRRQVGVLRSLGFEARAVRRAFVVEVAFVALEGVLIGVALGLITALSITLTPAFGETLEFSAPPFQILVLVLGTLFCALLATIGPANQAARIKPAVALRIAD